MVASSSRSAMRRLYGHMMSHALPQGHATPYTHSFPRYPFHYLVQQVYQDKSSITYQNYELYTFPPQHIINWLFGLSTIYFSKQFIAHSFMNAVCNTFNYRSIKLLIFPVIVQIWTQNSSNILYMNNSHHF